MKKILFVCTGNTCRSPMAQAIFNDLVQKESDMQRKYTAISAGISVYEGMPASEKAVKVLQEEWGVDLREHKARLVSLDIVEESYLTLTMCSEHKALLINGYPEFRNKIFTLKEYAYNNIINRNKLECDSSLNISDPFGKSLEEYKKCAVEIRDAVIRVISLLNTDKHDKKSK